MKPYYAVLAILIAPILLIGCTLSSSLEQPSPDIAQSNIPNLTGIWNVESIGSVMPKLDHAWQVDSPQGFLQPSIRPGGCDKPARQSPARDVCGATGKERKLHRSYRNG